jgi:hypothetical protein
MWARSNRRRHHGRSVEQFRRIEPLAAINAGSAAQFVSRPNRSKAPLAPVGWVITRTVGIGGSEHPHAFPNNGPSHQTCDVAGTLPNPHACVERIDTTENCIPTPGAPAPTPSKSDALQCSCSWMPQTKDHAKPRAFTTRSDVITTLTHPSQESRGANARKYLPPKVAVPLMNLHNPKVQLHFDAHQKQTRCQKKLPPASSFRLRT